jgi:hypothetical protein
MVGMIFLIALLSSEIYILQVQLKEKELEINQLKKMVEIEELNKTVTELNELKKEFAKLQEKFLKVSEELNRTKVRIPKPKIVGEINWEEIGEVLRKITPQAGSLCSRYRLTTKEEIERFLSIIEYPEGMDENGKPWYLMSKFIEWTTPDYIAVGLGHGYGGKIGGPFTRTVFVIVQGEEGYELYMIDIEKGNKLVLLQPGDFDRLTIIFP